LRTALIDIAIGFVGSCIVGLLNPGYEPSLEVEARGQPDLFDLAIALASGMAGAYAIRSMAPITTAVDPCKRPSEASADASPLIIR
jgi:uncharacterized membrane protein